MREVQFLQRNKDNWKRFEGFITGDNAGSRELHPDELGDLFIHVTDDLAYSKTYFPKSKTTRYLNQLASHIHRKIYKSRKEDRSRIISFWKEEVPLTFYKCRRQIFWSFVIVLVSSLIGGFSAAKDPTFVRLILGDSYVNKTEQMIEEGNPLGVYSQRSGDAMFAFIPWHNLKVALFMFISGITANVLTFYLLFQNGIMLGSFQTFFFIRGLGFESVSVVWLHGTIEISSMIIEGAAGLVLGNALLFPKSYSRSVALLRNSKLALKMFVGLVPLIIVAGFIESYISRFATMPVWLAWSIILGSLWFVLWYFVFYPRKLGLAQEAS